MRIFLIILLVLLLILAILCMVTVSLSLELWDGKLKWCVKVCGIRILPRKRKSGEKKKEKKADEQDTEEKQTEEKKPEEERTEEEQRRDFFMDKLLKILQKLAKYADYIGSALFSMPKLLRTFCKSITWSHIETDIVVANEDAYQCAKQYGYIQMFLQNMLTQAGRLITVKRKQVKVVCDFTADQSRWNFGFRLKIRLGPIIAAAIYFLIHFLKDMCKANKSIVDKKI